MITKQQALEFIYKLLKEYTLEIDVTNSDGFLEISSNKYRTETFEAFADSLEEFMTKFIKQYLNTDIFENMDKIPVDIDMLEVGQTYKVTYLDCVGVENSFTDKLVEIDTTNKTIFRFSTGYYFSTNDLDIREIYKVSL